MSYTKTLLASAAICALCTTPALARTAPSIHVAGIDSKAKAHVKNIIKPDITHITETITFSASLSASADYKLPVLLWGETWQDTATCIPPNDERGRFPQHTAVAKISVGTTTGPTSACPSSTFTFYGPLYKLESQTATSDSFQGEVSARHYSGYHLKLRANTNVNIGA